MDKLGSNSVKLPRTLLDEYFDTVLDVVADIDNLPLLVDFLSEHGAEAMVKGGMTRFLFRKAGDFLLEVALGECSHEDLQRNLQRQLDSCKILPATEPA